ncbi:MAG: LPS export ABC transporter periplasmic protein LptC [Elusimicrobiaceae bacterium]|nr:LPS export ABC transporter periplasmic protein LptC [Elusimicrobiaceae bacterium]
MKKFFILSCLLLIIACAKKENFSPDDNNGAQIASQVSIFESKGNQQQWLLTAQAVDFADLTNATLKNPILLLKQNGQDSARITGDTGIFDYGNKRVTVEGNAQINSLSEQTVITAPRFFYDIDADRAWSDQKTIITRGSAKTIARGGIETDSKLTKIELKNQTTRLPQDKRELTTHP